MKWQKHYPLNEVIRIIYVKCLAHYRQPIKYGGGDDSGCDIGNDGGDAVMLMVVVVEMMMKVNEMVVVLIWRMFQNF